MDNALNKRLREALETLAGFRGPKGSHAIRFKDVEGLNASSLAALQRAILTLQETNREQSGEINDLRDTIGSEGDEGSVADRVANALADAATALAQAQAAFENSQEVTQNLSDLTEGFVGTLAQAFTDEQDARVGDIDELRNATETAIAPLLPPTIRRPARNWTHEGPNPSHSGWKPSINESWLRTDQDPDFMDAIRIAGFNRATGNAYPLPFNPNAVYKVTARLKVVDDGTGGGSLIRLGASTMTGATAHDTNVQKLVADVATSAQGVQIFESYFSANASKLADMGLSIGSGVDDDAQVLPASAAAQSVYFHARVNSSAANDAEVWIAELKFQDVTAIADQIKVIRTELEGRIDDISATLTQDYIVAATVYGAISALETDLRAEFSTFTSALSVGDFANGSGDWTVGNHTIVTSTSPALPNNVTHAMELTGQAVFDGPLRPDAAMAGRVMRFTGWVLTENSAYDAQIGVHTRRSDGVTNDFTNETVRIAGAAGWAQFTADVTLPADVDQWRPSLRTSDTTDDPNQNVFWANLFLRDVSGVAGLDARLTNDYRTAVDQDIATAQALDTFRTVLRTPGPDGDINAIWSELNDNRYTKTEVDEARAQQTQELTAVFGGAASLNILRHRKFGDGIGPWVGDNCSLSTFTTSSVTALNKDGIRLTINPGETIARAYERSSLGYPDMRGRTVKVTGKFQCTNDPNLSGNVGFRLERENGSLVGLATAPLNNPGGSVLAAFEVLVEVPDDEDGVVSIPTLGILDSGASSGRVQYYDLLFEDVTEVEGGRITAEAYADEQILALSQPGGAIAAIQNNLNVAVTGLRGESDGLNVTLDGLSVLHSAVSAALSGQAAVGQGNTVIVTEAAGPRTTTQETNAGAVIRVEEEKARQFSARRIKISILAREPAANAATRFGIAYSTADAGNSGYMGADEDLSPNFQWFTFFFDVPTAGNGGPDYLGIYGDMDQNGNGVEVARINIQIAAESGDLPEIATLQGDITNIMGLDADFVSGTVFGTFLQELSVNAAGQIAGIENFGSVMANLQERSEAAYVFRVKAGGQTGEFEMTAYEDAQGGGSAVTINFDNIFARGFLQADKLAVGVSTQMLRDSDFSQGLANVSLSGAGEIGQNSSIRIREPGQSYAGASYPTLMIQSEPGSPTANGWARARFSPHNADGSLTDGGFPVKAGEWYEAHAQVASIRADFSILLIWYLEGGGTESSTLQVVTNQSPQSAGNPEEWGRYGGIRQAPNNAVSVRMMVHLREITSGADGILFVHHPFLGKTVEGARWSSYGTGQATLITGKGIVTSSIMAEHMDVVSLSSAGLDIFDGFLQSNPYVAGSTGWRIDRNGDMELNNLVARGWVIDGAISDGGPFYALAETGRDRRNDSVTPVFGTPAISTQTATLFAVSIAYEFRGSLVVESNNYVRDDFRLEFFPQVRDRIGGVWSEWRDLAGSAARQHLGYYIGPWEQVVAHDHVATAGSDIQFRIHTRLSRRSGPQWVALSADRAHQDHIRNIRISIRGVVR